MVDRSPLVTFHVRDVEATIPDGVDAVNGYLGEPAIRLGEVRRCACGKHTVWIPDPSYQDMWGIYV